MVADIAFMIFVTTILLRSNNIAGDHVDLNSCFVYKKDHRLELNTNDIESTESVEFKDDCLRSCLRALLSGGFICRSLMHMPKDNDCVLTALDGEKAIRTEHKQSQIPVNFYENSCAKLPVQGGDIQGLLRGFRGGEGLIELVQGRGSNTFIFIILDGVHENKNFDILYHEDEIKDCFKMSVDERRDGKKLITADSDGNGMAVQPWTNIEFEILRDSILNKTITVVENGTDEVILCGKLKVKGSMEDWVRAKNSAHITANLNKVWATVILCFLATQI